MRVSTKLALSLISIGLALFVGYGLYELSVERLDLSRAISLQTRLLGKSLQIAVENAIRDKQLADIEELLKALEQIEPELKIRVYDRQGNAFPDAIGYAYASDFQERLRAALKDERDDLFFYPDEEPEYITLLLPLQNPRGENLGILVFVRALQEMHRDLHVTQRNLAISALAFIVIAAPLSAVIGLIYIGQPLKRLADGMRRIKDGNFAPLAMNRRQDEVGVLLQAFNAMATELDNARQKLREEAQSRRVVQAALLEADKLITIGQLSAGLAHEIGSPLQIVNGRARDLAKRADNPAEVRRVAEIIVAQTERITRIVQRLLEFVRRRPPETAPCDVAAAVAEVLELLRYDANRRGIGLDFIRPDRLPAALANKDWIQQIALNLLGNALAATESGGTITVELCAAEMPRAGNTIAALRFCVTDTGKGIAAAHLPQLFEPFFTTRGDQGGTGLGLAVVKTIVTELGGTIAAESELGKGSRFTVHLPLYLDGAWASPPAMPPV